MITFRTIDAQDLKRLRLLLESVGEVSLTVGDHRELAELATSRMVHRTREGRGAGDKAFRRYSPRYEQMRLERGRGALPDLTFTGQMLADLMAEGTAEHGVVRFASQTMEQRARYHASKSPRSRMPLRDFFGIVENDSIHQVLEHRAFELVTRRAEEKLHGG